MALSDYYEKRRVPEDFNRVEFHKHNISAGGIPGVRSNEVEMKRYGSSYSMNMENIRGHIHVAETEPIYEQHNNPMAQQITMNMSQKLAAQVDDCVADEIYKMMMSRLERVPIVKHECHGCGAVLELDADKHIFVCKYCGACYAIGTALIKSR